MAKTSNSKVKLVPNAARAGSSVARKYITGKGATAANPAAPLEAFEKSKGLKGPRHG